MRPTHWWNPKYPTMPNQLTAPNEGGGWEASYSADQLRQAKVKVLREAAAIIKEYGLVAFGNGSAHYNEGINYGANECVRIAQDLEDGK